jgi:hypothetical protein
MVTEEDGFSKWLEEEREKIEKAARVNGETQKNRGYQIRNTYGVGHGDKVNDYTVKRNSNTDIERYENIAEDVASDVYESVDPGDKYRILDVGSSFGVAAQNLKLEVLERLYEEEGEDYRDRIEVYELDQDPELFGLENELEMTSDIGNDRETEHLSNPTLGVAQKIPFEEDTFDLTISHEALTPLGDNELDTAVSEIQRVTKRRGEYAVVTGDGEKDSNRRFLSRSLEEAF